MFNLFVETEEIDRAWTQREASQDDYDRFGAANSQWRVELGSEGGPPTVLDSAAASKTQSESGMSKKGQHRETNIDLLWFTKCGKFQLATNL